MSANRKKKPSIKKGGRLAGVERKLRVLGKKIDAVSSNLTYRSSIYTSRHAALGAMGTYALSAGDIQFIEQGLAVAKVFNSSTGALDTVDLRAGDTNKAIMILGWSKEMMWRNNYTTPLDYTIWACVAKRDTSKSAFTLFNDGLSAVTNATSNSELIFPSDIFTLTDLYTVKRLKKGQLQAGSEVRVSHHHNKSFEYAPQLSNELSELFVPRYGSMQFLVRFKGPLAHDNTTSASGITEAQMDIVERETINYQYDGGADFSYVHVVDGDNTMPNGSVVTNFRVKANQPFSIS